MTEVPWWMIALAAWLLLQAPLAMLVGRWLKRCDEERR